MALNQVTKSPISANFAANVYNTTADFAPADEDAFSDAFETGPDVQRSPACLCFGCGGSTSSIY